MNAKYDQSLTPLARLIYAELLLKTCYGTRATKVSDFELAAAFKISERSVARSLSKLCKSGYLRKGKILNSRALYIISQ